MKTNQTVKYDVAALVLLIDRNLPRRSQSTKIAIHKDRNRQRSYHLQTDKVETKCKVILFR